MQRKIHHPEPKNHIAAASTTFMQKSHFMTAYEPYLPQSERKYKLFKCGIKNDIPRITAPVLGVMAWPSKCSMNKGKKLLLKWQ